MLDIIGAFLIASATVTPASAGTADWTLDKSASRLEFSATQTGKGFKGAFSSFDADIRFDPANLAAANIVVTVNTSSAATGDKQRDAALPTSEWFATKAFPAATFAASKVIAQPDGSYVADGTLTIRGISKPLELPFAVEISGDRAVAEGEVKLVRTDFGVGQGEFATDEWVGFDVAVRFHIEASR
jgi:polyisoprenoid-binding protein YceI